MRAVIVLAQRVLRTSIARTGLVVLVLAASLGFALFSATAARRTSTAFDRFVAWSAAADAVTGGAAGDVPVADHFAALEALPSVVDSQRNMAIGLNGVRVHGKVVPPSRFFASVVDADAAHRFDRALVLQGSIPAAPAADEGIIDFVTARQLDLGVGDQITLLASAATDEQQDQGVPPTEIPIRVVAIVSTPTSIPTVAGYQFNGVAVGPAFLTAHPDVIDPWESSLSLRLRHGLDSVDDLRHEMADAGLEIDLQDRSFVEVGANRLFTLEATTMWVAALLALIVGLPVGYQLVRRDAAAIRERLATVLAIGASRRQLALAAATRGAAVAVVASVVGGAGAVLASPSSPVGLARNAEIERGVYVDWAVLAVGIPLFVVAVALLATIAVLRGGIVRRDRARSERAARTRQPRVPLAVGVRMATGSRGPVAVAGIGALAFVSLLVVGISVAAASLDAVPDDPDVSGGAWDGFLLVDSASRPEVEAALDEEPAVTAHGPGGWTTLTVKGQDVYTVSLPDSIDPAMASGRAPHGDREVALGAAAMRRLDVHIGDEVPVEIPDSGLEPRSLTVTGEVITAAPLFYSHAPDDAAVVSFQVPGPPEQGSGELVRFEREGTDPQETLEQVVSDLPDGSVYFSFARGRRGDVVALEELEGLINAILGMAAVLALASLLHQVLVTHRRNAPELGVLRALGFTKGNVAEAGAAHGGTLAVIAALVAVPVGLAAGAVSWRYLAGELVVLPRTRYDLAGIIGVAVVVAALAAAMAAWLARRSARRPVARALRAE